MNFIAEITLKDSELMKIPGVKKWLDDVKSVINKNIENEYKKHLDLMIFGSSFEDENGKRIDPAERVADIFVPDCFGLPWFKGPRKCTQCRFFVSCAKRIERAKGFNNES